MIRVAVLGAAGKMGREVCRALSTAADPGIVLAARIDPRHAGDLDESGPIVDSLDALTDSAVDVAVDFTRSAAAAENARWCLGHGVHVVIGTTGIAPEDLDEIGRLARDVAANAIVVPNFAIGAVLMMRFAEQAARHFDAAEVIELHHDQKADAPSGTAIATAERIATARASVWKPPGGDDAHPGARGAEIHGIRVHGVRLPGLLAHQEVILGGPGQTLTIRHDTTDRTSFIPGVMLAIRAVASRPGLTVGLDAVLDAP
jgi:4-hydroxy-tetrahydrodipicolinate reductase